MEYVSFIVGPSCSGAGILQDSVPVAHHQGRSVWESIRKKDVLNPAAILKSDLDLSASVELRLYIRTMVPSLEVCYDVVKDGSGTSLSKPVARSICRSRLIHIVSP